VWEKTGNSGAKGRIERAEWIYNRHNTLKKLILKSDRRILLADLSNIPSQPGPPVI
jgi:hypothetical protein